MAPLCRDCLAESADDRRCGACGSPRLLRHAERDSLSVAHIDCDAFYAAIEKRDNPAIRDRPVIIGGGTRGVVSTACYIARTWGVHSAMPMFKALKACPEAVVIRPDMDKYVRVGREVRERMLSLTPLVEPISIDEAFLDLSGTEALHGRPAAATLAAFARDIERDIGITVSVGLSCNKFLAKVASDLEKPRGFSIIGRAEALDFLAEKPVGLIWGVGKVTQERLAAAGFRTIGDLRRLDAAGLVRKIGGDGLRLHALAHGIDARKVEPGRETKSVSAETTFDRDVRDMEELAAMLWRLSEKVSRRAKAQGLSGSSVTLKLKTADFRIVTRARSGLPPTQLALRIYHAARDLLLAEASRREAYRLIGVGLQQLGPAGDADRGDLVDTTATRDKATEEAIDRLRAKFGEGSIGRGIGLGRAGAGTGRN
jgi:DNA polymerase-4